jgi:hypothetical protein
MIIIRTIEAVTGITSPELRQLIRERIAEITQGQPYDADIYGEVVIVEAGESLSKINYTSYMKIAWIFIPLSTMLSLIKTVKVLVIPIQLR